MTHREYENYMSWVCSLLYPKGWVLSLLTTPPLPPGQPCPTCMKARRLRCEGVSP